MKSNSIYFWTICQQYFLNHRYTDIITMKIYVIFNKYIKLKYIFMLKLKHTWPLLPFILKVITFVLYYFVIKYLFVASMFLYLKTNTWYFQVFLSNQLHNNSLSFLQENWKIFLQKSIPSYNCSPILKQKFLFSGFWVKKISSLVTKLN